MSTDKEWEKWGQKDPYFGVITHEKYRNANLSEEAKNEFFQTGRDHIAHVLDQCRRHLTSDFMPVRALDFGCGTGRLVIPLAELCHHVTGIDISESMLNEARKNCQQRQLENVEFILSDDHLSRLKGEYNFIHSFIVFQHMAAHRGILLFIKLMEHLQSGGIMAVQFTYSKSKYHKHHGVPPWGMFNDLMARLKLILKHWKSILLPGSDPEMQMNPYPLNSLLYLIHARGIHDVHVEFTDHGGEFGVFLYFQKP